MRRVPSSTATSWQRSMLEASLSRRRRPWLAQWRDRRSPVATDMRALAIVMAILHAGPALGQELEPRSYSAAPVGTSFLIAGIGGSAGAVLFGPSLPVDQVRADLT